MTRLSLLLAVAVLGLSGCGVYVHRGGGSYSFIGLGTERVARRCSAYASNGFTGKCLHDKSKDCPR